MSEYRKKGNCNKPYREKNKTNSGGSSRSGPSGSKMTHPPELKGKAIGLWYRDKNRKNEVDRIPVISLPRYIFNTIELLLDISKKKASSEMMESQFKEDFLKKLEGSFQEDMDCEIQSLKTCPRTTSSISQKRKTIPDDIIEFQKKLPAYKMKGDILQKIRENQIVVISGETGCGKTTQVVQYVLDEAIENSRGAVCKIVCTQPRRISAISVAERVAVERGESIGQSVGYQIRLEKSRPTENGGTIMFVTTGIILQWIQGNPLLNGISHLFLDEVHERDILSDFVLACLKQIIKKRTDLKVILMSATMNAERFSEYFGGAPCMHIPGFTYPVEEFNLEQILEITNFTYEDKKASWGKRPMLQRDSKGFCPVRDYVKQLEAGGVVSRRVANELLKPDAEKINADLIAAVAHHICRNEREGAILIFVPGLGDINHVNTALQRARLTGRNYQICHLHSSLPTFNQRHVFNKPPEGVRKIVIATNIAETSITIDDVVFVIDSGFIKVRKFDKSLNVSSLNSEWIATSNARQRRGRAGRVQPGKLYKLYTSYREGLFAPYPLPEMQRTRLDEVILMVKMLKLGKAADFLETVLDPPDLDTVHVSVNILKSLNALSDDEQLTPLGFHLAKLPLEPQIGKMILMSALFGCVDPILSIAACLSYRDPFSAPFEQQHLLMQAKEKLAGRHKSDHYVYYAAMQGWEEARRSGENRSFVKTNFLHESTLHLLSDMKKQFAQHLHEMEFLQTPDPKDKNGNANSENMTLVKAIVCAGLYPNVAFVKTNRSQGKPASLKTQNHPSVKLHTRSICSRCESFESPYLVYQMILQTSGIFLHDATVASPWALLFFGKTLDIVEFDGVSGIRVDSLIKLNCFRKTGMLIQKLRMRLDGILAHAIKNPGVIDWTSQEKPPVLEAIVELITAATEGSEK